MDVFCPSCGYNLHEIPEIRCPECGFGFDRAAVEATAIAEFEKHFATYSGIVVRSTFGIAFSLPAVLHRFGIIGGAPAIVLAGFVAAYLVKRRFGRYRADGLLDWPPGLPRIAVAVIALSMFLVAGPQIGSLLAAACLLDAAMVWAHGSGGHAFADCSLPPGGQRRLAAYRMGAGAAFGIAVVSLVLPWT